MTGLAKKLRISLSNSSIRLRIFAIILLAAAPAFALFVYDSSSQYQAAYRTESKNLLDMARLAASNETKVIEGVHDLMLVIAEQPFVSRRDWGACNAFLTRINARIERLSSFSIANARGDILCSGSPLKARPNIRDRAYFKTVLQEKRFVGAGYVVNRLTREPTSAFALPIVENGEVVGAVLASLDLEAFTSVLREIKIPPGARISILDNHGIVLASEPDGQEMVGKPLPSAAVLAQLMPAQPRVIEGENAHKAEQLFAIAPALHEGQPVFYVAAALDKAVLAQPANRSLASHLAALMAVVVLSLLGTWLAGRSLLIAPVGKIIRALKQVAGGDLKARTGLNSQAGELAELAYHFDLMAAALEKREEENRAATQFIEYLAQHDELTKLSNRRELYQRLGQIILEAKKSGRQAAVLFLDIDNFAAVNDSLGPAAGDRLLVYIADTLQKRIEPDDGFAARLGGDEFVCVIPNIEGTAQVERIAESLSQALSHPYAIQDAHVITRASIGISLSPADSDSSISAVQYAQMAMRVAKERGSKPRFFTKEMNLATTVQIKLEGELHRALERGEFVLYYQPQVDLRENLIVGAEALIRWQHPEKGLISPDSFIALAEKTRLVIGLGEWALRAACFQNKAWSEAGLLRIPVAVNVSAHQFSHLGFLDSLRQALSDSKLPSQDLELEVTEGALLAGDADAILSEVHRMGVSLSIDDFGTGYSSLSYLKNYPFDKLKIDQSFIKDVTGSEDNRAITRAIVTIAKSLELRVIAEGVEDAATFEFLRSLKCDAIQGYYYSRPVPANEFAQLLKQQQQRSVRPAVANLA